jgi:hypothetical protein
MDTRPEPPTSQLPLVLAIALDVLVTIESMLVALLFRFEGMVPKEFWNRFWAFAAFSVVVFVVLLLVGGAYRGATSRVVIIATATSVMIATGALLLANVGMDFVWARPVPPTVILLGGVLALVQLVALRLLYARTFRERSEA